MSELATRWARHRLWWGIGLSVLLVAAVASGVLVRCVRASEPSPPTFELSEQPVSPQPTGEVIEGSLEMPEYWLAVGQQYRFDHDDRGLFDQHPVIVTITEIGTRDDDGRPWAQVRYRFDDGTGDAGTIRTYPLVDADDEVTNIGQFRLQMVLTAIHQTVDASPAYVTIGAVAAKTDGMNMRTGEKAQNAGSDEITMHFGGRFSTDEYQPLTIGGAKRRGPADGDASIGFGVSEGDTPRTYSASELYRGDSITLDGIATVTLLDYSLYPETQNSDPYAVGGNQPPEGEMTVRIDWPNPATDQ